jgi:maleylpyruvate isomerase
VKLVLHNYWRSSASQRVRIALGLKGLLYEYVVVNIVKRDQFTDAYRAKNPMSQVPSLVVTEDDGASHVLTQSLPIIEYLDERVPAPALLPREPYLRARARALAEIINSGVQPLQNLSTTNAVKQYGCEPAEWVKPFIASGLASFAASCADVAGAFCVGDAPTVADCFLVPQLASARRFGVDYAQLPHLADIEARCLALPAFANAVPEAQPDAVAT